MTQAATQKRKIAVVYFGNGDTITTEINGTTKEIQDYYAPGNLFNIGQVEDNMQPVTDVEVLTPMGTERNEFVKFNDKGNMCHWFKYSTNWPEKDAMHLIWFEYGICQTIQHFNTDESNKPLKERCLNKLMYNKWIVEVVVRQPSGPHKQVVPFEESLCNSLPEALKVAAKYNKLHYEAAREAQLEHMRTFKTTDLT